MQMYPSNRTAPAQFATAVVSSGTLQNSGTISSPGTALYLHVTAAANITLTLAGQSDTMIVQPGTGEVMYPFAVSKVAINSGTVDYAYALK